MPNAPLRSVVLAASLAALAALLPHGARAQQPARQWEPRGFDFKRDGVWRRRARLISRTRAALMRRGDFRTLNSTIGQVRSGASFVQAGAAPQSATAVTGVLNVPVFLVRFKNTDTTRLRAPAEYASVLLDSVAPPGRPYTVRTFYQEMSHGLFSVHGVVIGWIALDSNDTWYAGGGTCDGICFNSRVAPLIREAVAKADPAIDWNQFDADHDGEVDLIWVIQPKPGAECGYQGNIWAHRYYYSAWTGAPLPTPSTAPGGGKVMIDNYTIQSGVGGIAVGGGGALAGCDSTSIMPPGTVAHETGHGLDLPDFYDTNPGDQDNSEGIGEWGLMGSGNWARQGSPAHMEAFSLVQLGWVHVEPLALTGSFRFGPVETGDTVFALRPTAVNPRGEYFLLENRQGLLADSAMIAKHHGGGLLVWHVDSTQYARCTLPSNCVNTGPIHGLSLVQADGLDNLGSSAAGQSNRGDGGDPYPGSTANAALGLKTVPAATMNSDGGTAGFTLDSITQVVPNGEMSFRLRVASVVTVRAADALAQIRVRDSLYTRYENLFLPGDTLTVSMDSAQLSPDARRKYLFTSWSDGLARTHLVTLGAATATFTAALARQFLVAWSAHGAGAIGASPNASLSGSFVGEGDSVTLTAVAAAGQVFASWTGDTTSLNPVLTLKVGRPWNVVATFMDPLTADAIVNQFLNRAVALSADQVRYLDLLGNNNGRLDIGDIAAWLDKTGTPQAVLAMQRVSALRAP